MLNKISICFVRTFNEFTEEYSIEETVRTTGTKIALTVILGERQIKGQCSERITYHSGITLENVHSFIQTRV